uniref:Uncharacterized protein n=1 Tax=viral metagenome TaxID=1070528 RepID=A0A6C0EDY0_9ZZZZ
MLNHTCYNQWFNELPADIKNIINMLFTELNKYPIMSWRKEWIDKTYKTLKNNLSFIVNECVYILEIDLISSLIILIKQIINEILINTYKQKQVLLTVDLQCVLVNLLLNNSNLIDQNNKHILIQLSYINNYNCINYYNTYIQNNDFKNQNQYCFCCHQYLSDHINNKKIFSQEHIYNYTADLLRNMNLNSILNILNECNIHLFERYTLLIS